MSTDQNKAEFKPLAAPYVRLFRGGSRLRMSDVERLANESVLYVILITPRSGSTWLCELVGASGRLGMPQEWFNQDFVQSNEEHLGCKPPKLRSTLDVNCYLKAIVEEGEGIAGVQLSIWQAKALIELSEGQIPVDKIKWFYLRRRDILEQAISLYRSSKSGYWHSYQGKPDKLNSVTFDLEECTKKLSALINCETMFEDMLTRCGIDPLRLYYEDIKSNPLKSLKLISESLGSTAPESLPNTSIKQLRNKETDSWKAEFLSSPIVQKLLSSRPEMEPIPTGSCR